MLELLEWDNRFIKLPRDHVFLLANDFSFLKLTSPCLSFKMVEHVVKSSYIQFIVVFVT